ncbi:hypothetical protein JL09_g5715 [Pichia kudriavzevii]|uniref:Uncharacterized protein n=1 Tax=Pichia kudriavzevii TaxID=4909 RepID=A0A099NL09_PICKU|nr:hypothetical protein JL09_g6776 [Pichia kudriavzevii]KGK35135.1 hypothetical protein JL09_g5715 [Pichia kudriavzevii]
MEEERHLLLLLLELTSTTPILLWPSW